MKATLPVLLSLVLLPMLAPASLAGPPEAPSDRMAFDVVADGLRKYRQEPDEGKRAAWLRRLAPSCDPRVAVELWEVFAWVRGKRTAAIRIVARDCLADYYVTREGRPLPDLAQSDAGRAADVCSWWAKNGGDLRRRAKQLPR